MDYKIETISEHSYIPSMFTEKAHVLDAGCRGFDFAFHFIDKKTIGILCIDADDLETKTPYLKMALTDFVGTGYLVRSEDKQATRVQKQPMTTFHVNCTTIAEISKGMLIDFWDLIKLDIEGSEYEVIMSMEKAWAKQLSIEFHLHTGIYGMHEMDLMMDKLKALGYQVIQHNYESRHGAGFNFWDSLFILP